jgi:cytochrome c peroxidase
MKSTYSRTFGLGTRLSSGPLGVTVPLIVWGALATGCEQDSLSTDERSSLQGMRLPSAPPADPTNAVAASAEAAALGQQFFFDRRLSGKLLEDSNVATGGLGTAGTPGTVACSTCHDPAAGGADRRPLGGTSLAAAWTGRNSMSVLNAAYSSWLFWDGRRDSLWSQALAPLESATEHNITRLELVHLIFDHYREPYEAIFGALPPMNDSARFPHEGRPGMASYDGMTADDRGAVDRAFANVGKAIAAYERLLVDRSSPFDRFLDGDTSAISASAQRGAKLFVGRAACNECHDGPMLADGRFHNHGVPQTGAKIPAIDVGREGGIAMVVADEFNGASVYSDSPHADVLNLQASPADLGAFKTPTLRNVNKTGPYMHTGAFTSLWEVVSWYNDAAGTDGFSGMRAAASAVPLRLSREDIDDLVEFLRSLDGDPLPAALVTAPALP